MNKTLLFLAGISLFTCGRLMLAQELQEKLIHVNSQRESDIAAANKRFAERLQKLLRTAKQAGDLDVSEKIEWELKALVTKPSVIPAQRDFRGVWRNSGENEVRFLSAGRFQETLGSELMYGTWKVIGDEAVVSRRDGSIWHFMMAPDGRSIMRKEKPIIWNRVVLIKQP